MRADTDARTSPATRSAANNASPTQIPPTRTCAGRDRPAHLKGKEVASVEGVTLVGRAGPDGARDRANVRLRLNRNPIIGDKFSSRHGQKGVLSKLWPDADMPYAATTGMRPDLIINPNAFPSRMTIGMLMESLAAKAGALTGEWVDATPFQTAGGSKESPAEAFGRALEANGFAKHGGACFSMPIVRSALVWVARRGLNSCACGHVAARRPLLFHAVPPPTCSARPPLLTPRASAPHPRASNRPIGEAFVSGVTGEEFPADVYVGCVYYQRLRHMVSDKFQVRSTGGVDPVLFQPIKGRKVGGGIRFGEMERDSLIAHGAAYLLHDRLHGSSDYKPCHVCTACQSILSSTWERYRRPEQQQGGQQPPGGPGGGGRTGGERGRWACLLCHSSKYVEQVALPAVFKFLVAELAAMNIRVRVDVGDPRLRAEA